MFGNIGVNDFGFDVIRPTHFGSIQRQREADARSERRLAQTDRSLDLRERSLAERERHNRNAEAYNEYKQNMHDYQFERKAEEREQKRKDMLDMFDRQMELKWAREHRMARKEHQGGK